MKKEGKILWNENLGILTVVFMEIHAETGQSIFKTHLAATMLVPLSGPFVPCRCM